MKIKKLKVGKDFPIGGRRKYNGKFYYLKSLFVTKIGAEKEKAKYKKAGKFVRIWKGSGKFPYHVFVR